MSGKMIKDNKCFGGEIAVVKLKNQLVNGNVASMSQVDYPDGFDLTNCIVAGVQRMNSVSKDQKESNKVFTENSQLYNTIEVYLRNNVIAVYLRDPSGTGTKQYDVDVLLCRYE